MDECFFLSFVLMCFNVPRSYEFTSCLGMRTHCEGVIFEKNDTHNINARNDNSEKDATG
jgi:hypothetical protein